MAQAADTDLHGNYEQLKLSVSVVIRALGEIPTLEDHKVFWPAPACEFVLLLAVCRWLPWVVFCISGCYEARELFVQAAPRCSPTRGQENCPGRSHDEILVMSGCQHILCWVWVWLMLRRPGPIYKPAACGV